MKRVWVLLIFLLVCGSLSYFLVGRAESKSQEKTLRLSGHIGVTVTDLVFMVPGKIATIKFQEGQEVKAGEVVAELDPKDLRQEVEAAQGKLDMANAVPGRPARVRDADLKLARAGLELAKSRLGYATLTSPVNGVVLVRAAQPGEVATVGATMLSVGDLDNVWFEGYLPRDLSGPSALWSESRGFRRYLPREKIPRDGFLYRGQGGIYPQGRGNL